MRKLLLILLSVFTFSAYAEEGVSTSDAQLTNVATATNAFVFSETSHFWWEGDIINMLDYAIIGTSDVPLDAPINIWCNIEYTDGTVSNVIFRTIPAGVTSFYDENLLLGSSISELGGYPGKSIQNVTYTYYTYRGTMDIIGLDNLRN